MFFKKEKYPSIASNSLQKLLNYYNSRNFPDSREHTICKLELIGISLSGKVIALDYPNLFLYLIKVSSETKTIRLIEENYNAIIFCGTIKLFKKIVGYNFYCFEKSEDNTLSFYIKSESINGYVIKSEITKIYKCSHLWNEFKTVYNIENDNTVEFYEKLITNALLSHSFSKDYMAISKGER